MMFKTIAFHDPSGKASATAVQSRLCRNCAFKHSARTRWVAGRPDWKLVHSLPLYLGFGFLSRPERGGAGGGERRLGLGSVAASS